MLLYLVVSSVLALGCAASQQRLAATRGAERRFVVVTGAWIVLIGAVGVVDYRRSPSHETPLVSYIAMAVLAPLCGAVAIAGVRAAGRPSSSQLVSGTLGFVVGAVTGLFGSLALASALPPWLGCCPL